LDVQRGDILSIRRNGGTLLQKEGTIFVWKKTGSRRNPKFRDLQEGEEKEGKEKGRVEGGVSDFSFLLAYKNQREYEFGGGERGKAIEGVKAQRSGQVPHGGENPRRVTQKC